MCEVYHEQSYSGKLLTLKQVSAILNIHPNTLRRWIETGAIEAIPLPRKPSQTRTIYRIKGETVDRLLHPPETSE